MTRNEVNEAMRRLCKNSDCDKIIDQQEAFDNLMPRYEKTLEDNGFMMWIAFIAPQYLFNLSVVGQSLKDYSDMIGSAEYYRALAGKNKEYTEKLCKEIDLLIRRIKVILDEYENYLQELE